MVLFSGGKVVEVGFCIFIGLFFYDEGNEFFFVHMPFECSLLCYYCYLNTTNYHLIQLFVSSRRVGIPRLYCSVEPFFSTGRTKLIRRWPV